MAQALPQLLCGVWRKRREHDHQRLDGLIHHRQRLRPMSFLLASRRVGKGVQVVHKLHQSGDRSVEMDPLLHVSGHAPDGLVGLSSRSASLDPVPSPLKVEASNLGMRSRTSDTDRPGATLARNLKLPSS